MKKLLLTAICMVVSLGMGASAMAKDSGAAKKQGYSRNYGMAGCGLGSMVVGKKGGQIFAATTNDTFYNQLFAITLGTSNCEDSADSQTAQRMDNFISGNRVALANDIARGNGETLVNLSKIMGCSDHTGQFGAAMQKHFRQIFPDAKVQPNEITDSIISTVLQDGELAQACHNVS